MGFISFNEKYYLEELSRFEGKRLRGEELYEVKQILKLLDDLADEGYLELNDALEGRFRVLARLRRILSEHGEQPFPLERAAIPEVHYGREEFEVARLCEELAVRAGQERAVSGKPFLREILRYSEWIGYESNTAYVFLLRDALLPYIYFRSRGRETLHPWLIGRAFLAGVSGRAHVDDEIRSFVYEALEAGAADFASFKAYCGERIRWKVTEYPPLKNALEELLRQIPEGKILVVESGYGGTIPMLLAALDERVDFRLYTTAPYLYETYKDKIFCKRYEDIRAFETLYSQDLLMKYASFRSGRFYVHRVCEESIFKEGLGEISLFT